jgi:hypothetical protein
VVGRGGSRINSGQPLLRRRVPSHVAPERAQDDTGLTAVLQLTQAARSILFDQLLDLFFASSSRHAASFGGTRQAVQEGFVRRLRVSVL